MIFLVIKYHSCVYSCGKFGCSDTGLQKTYGPYYTRIKAESVMTELEERSRDEDNDPERYWKYTTIKVPGTKYITGTDKDTTMDKNGYKIFDGPFHTDDSEDIEDESSRRDRDNDSDGSSAPY